MSQYLEEKKVDELNQNSSNKIIHHPTFFWNQRHKYTKQSQPNDSLTITNLHPL